MTQTHHERASESEIKNNVSPLSAEKDAKLEPQRSSRKYVLGGVGVVGAAGLALAGSLIFGDHKDGKDGPDISKTTVATAPITPGETPTTIETPSESPSPIETDNGAEQIAAIEIPANIPVEQLSETIIGRFSNWLMAGSDNVENGFLAQMKQTLDGSTDAESKFAFQVAQNNVKIYAPALFGADWQNNPNIQTFVQDMINENASVLMGVLTSQNKPTPYFMKLQYNSVNQGPSDDTTKHISIDYTIQDNAVEVGSTDSSWNGQEGLSNVGFSSSADGKVVIMSVGPIEPLSTSN